MPRVIIFFSQNFLHQFFFTDAYVTKYPQTSFEEYSKQLDVEMARPVYYDDSFVAFVNEMLGYKKEEVRMACSGKLPEVTKEPEIKLHESMNLFFVLTTF